MFTEEDSTEVESTKLIMKSIKKKLSSSLTLQSDPDSL